MRNEKSNKAIPFPVRFLTGALLLTGVVLAALVWLTLDSYQNATTGQLRNLRIEELRGTIVDLDEVLTMSARMAAATGDTHWERRYREFEPQLDAAIKEAMELTAHSAEVQAAAQTDAANLKLVEMENQSFALVRAGDAARAKAVLFSDAYEEQKKIYTEGMNDVIRQLKEQLSSDQLKKQREAFLAIIAAAICIVLLLFTWVWVLRSLNSWTTTQSASLDALTRAEEALHKLNDELENRVKNRTRSLELEIRERKQSEQALLASEEHLRFLNDLAEATRPLADPEQMMAVTSQMLGAHLHASRCAYAYVETDGEQFTIPHDYVDGCASTVGSYSLSLFGERAVATLKSGQTLIIHNVETELLPDEGADMFNAIGIKSIITCPLVKDGGLSAMMAVHQTTARDWTPGEVALIHDVVERCWATIERRTAEAALEQSQKRLRDLMDGLSSSMFVGLLTPQGILIEINQSPLAAAGLKPEDVLGKPFYETPWWSQSPAAQQQLREAIARGAAGEASRYDVRTHDAGNQVIDIDFSLQPLRDETGEVVFLISSASDITDRKRAEAEHEVISEIIQGVATTSNVDELLGLIHQSIKKVLYAENCFIALYDKKTELLNMEFFFDVVDVAEQPKKLGKGLAAYVFHEGRPVLLTREEIQELMDKEVVELLGTPPAVWLGVPLRTPDGIIGVLAVQHYEDKDAYRLRDLDLLVGVGDQIGLAIERKRAEKALGEKKERFRELVENANDVIYTLDLAGNFTSLNRAGETITGYSRAEAIQMSFADVIAPRYVAAVYERFALTLQGTAQPNFELEISAKDGRKLTMDVSSRLIVQGGVPVGLQGIGRDITERKRAEEETMRLNAEVVSQGERLNTIVGNVQGVVWETKTKIEKGEAFLRFDFISDYIETMLGYTVAECLANPNFWIELVHPDDRERTEQMVRAIFAGGKDGTLEFRWIAKDGHEIWVESRNMIVRDDAGKAVGLRGIAVDITERKSFEEQLTHQALHDPLTKLANRALFRDRVEHAIDRTVRTQTPVAVLFLDLDNFKSVNDSLGHSAGDELLVSVTERLKACLRPSDTPARLGGDEFAVLVEDIVHADEAAFIAERIKSVLGAPYLINGSEVFVNSSIGIASTTTGQVTTDEIIRNADVAMYISKANGKDQYTIFENKMHDDLIKRVRMESDMRAALEKREFEVYYQPILDLKSERVIGMEALVRWNHPEHGLVAPLDFIPLAEETGLIVPLGKWIMEEACKQAQKWQMMHGFRDGLSITVNVASRQFQDESLLKTVEQALGKSKLPPQNLVIEITETTMLKDTEATIKKLNELKKLGIRFAIDDFGTGYSSLSYLQRFPVDILKIDKSFIDRITQSKEGAAVAKAIITMSETLHLKTIAEGIESGGQKAVLRRLGCEMGQGYHFAKPLRAKAMSEFLRNSIEGDSLSIISIFANGNGKTVPATIG